MVVLCTVYSAVYSTFVIWCVDICKNTIDGQSTCPPWHLQHPISQECQKDHQGQQPPEPLPVHTTIIQKARSVQVYQSWDREIEKQLLSQGHQTAKQQSLAQRGCCLHWDQITGHFNKLITSQFKQCHFNNVYISYITYITCIHCILYHLLHLAYAARPSLIHILIFTYFHSPL
jgi:hypothetical protein